MRRITRKNTLNQLRRRAAKHGLAIRKDGSGYFLLVSSRSNFALDPEHLTFEELAELIDDLDEGNATITRAE